MVGTTSITQLIIRYAMASKSSFSKALKRLRSGRAPIITPLPALQFDMPDQDSGVDYEQKPEPWQGQGNKRKKPQRS